MPMKQPAPPGAASFDLLFHNHPLPMWIYDLETLAFLAVNDAAVQNYGYTYAEFLALTIADIRPAQDLPRLLADTAQARPPLQHSGLWRHRCKDGRLIDVEITSHTLEFNGRPAALVTAQDVSERVRAEETLRLAEANYHSVVENAPEGIFQSTLHGRLINANPAMARIFGYASPAEMVAQVTEIGLLIHPDPETRRSFTAQMQAKDLVTNFEAHSRRKDGTGFWTKTNAQAVRDAAGQLRYYVAFVTDVTARKQLERETSAAQDRLTNVLNSITDAFITLDRDWRITYINPEAARINKKRPEEFMGRTLWEEWPTLVGTLAEEHYRQAMTERVAAHFEHRYYDEGVYDVWLGIHAYPTDDGLALFYRDITATKQAQERLAENLLLLRIAGEKAKLGGWSVNLADNSVHWSDEVAAIHDMPAGHSPPVSEGISYYAPEWREKITTVFTQCAQAGIPYDEEMEIITANGRRAWVRTIGEAVRDASGRIVKVQGAFQDISARKRAEESMRQRLAELEALYTVSTTLRTAQTPEDALPLLLDQTLAALNTDAGAIRLYDPETGDLAATVDRGWFQHLSKHPLRPGEGIGGTVFSSGQIHLSAEFCSDPLARITPDGQPPAGWGGACVPIRTGAVTVGVMYVALPQPRQITPEQLKLLASLADMTGVTLYRLRLLQEAQKQASRIQGIMDTTPTGMILLEADGRILLANRVAERDLAILAAGTRMGDPLVRLGDRPLTELLAPPSAKGIWHTVRADSHIFEIIARPMTDAPQAPQWLLAINDVTQAQEQQRYQQAQERLATVGQLAAGIAHDFNNIMGVIILYADTLRRSQDLSERQQKQLNVVSDQAQQAAALIRQILDFSRRSVLDKTALDLLPLVKELVKLLERTLPESVRLDLTYDRGDYVINGDPVRLQQALMNLALNARDAMPHGGRLAFAFSALSLTLGQSPPLPDMSPGEWVCLTVADTGTGIPPENLPHIFEPFYTTKEPGKGSGLGLAQVYGIIKQHEGSLDVISQPGEGSTFALYLPIHMVATSGLPVQNGEKASGGSEAILVVEDNPAIRLSLVETLIELGYPVYSAADGVAALGFLAEREPEAVDLLITDLVMPGMGGMELAQNVRQNYPNIRILPMSGHPLDQDGEELRQMGAEAWLQKPFGITELAAKVRMLLDQ